MKGKRKVTKRIAAWLLSVAMVITTLYIPEGRMVAEAKEKAPLVEGTDLRYISHVNTTGGTGMTMINNSEYPNRGDLNCGAGGRIDLYASFTSNPDEAITKFWLKTGKNNTGITKIVENGVTYNVTCVTGDLNVGAGGDYIYLYYTKDKAAGDPIASVGIWNDWNNYFEYVTNNGTALHEYVPEERAELIDTYNYQLVGGDTDDLNDNAGGAYVYMLYKRAPYVKKADSSFVYDGKPHSPNITVGSGTTLTKSKDSVTDISRWKIDFEARKSGRLTIVDSVIVDILPREQDYEMQGSGTADDPYLISNPYQLAKFSELVKNDTSDLTNRRPKICGELLNDIDLSCVCNEEIGPWKPIGTMNMLYGGTFNGNGHRITGLYLKSDDSYLGLFGMVERAYIHDLDVTGYVELATINKTYGDVGGIIVGKAGDKSVIENCISRGSVSGPCQALGGIVGRMEGSQVINCQNYADVHGKSSIGGIAGYMKGYASIENCLNAGTISSSNSDNLTKTICGYNYSKNIAKQTNNLNVAAPGAGCAEDATYYGYANGTGNVTKTQLQNGEVAYLLNGSKTENDSVWGQILTGTDKQNYPIPGGEKVYRLWPCIGYTNDSNAITKEHVTTKPVNCADTFRCEVCGNMVHGPHAFDKVDAIAPTYVKEGSNEYFVCSICNKVFKDARGEFETTVEAEKLAKLEVEMVGDGTAENPYQISNAAQLSAFRDYVNAGQTKLNAVLIDDIDLSSVCGENIGSWEPIGTEMYNVEYRGVFDGNGHKILGLYIYSNKWGAGLFGYVSQGTICNLEVNGYVHNNTRSVGMIAGGVRGSKIDSCITRGTVEADNHIGGIAGDATDHSSITRCQNYATIIIWSFDAYSGGIVGENQWSEISNCLNAGKISSRGSVRGIGTICYNYGGSKITGCLNLGEIPSAGIENANYYYVNGNGNVTVEQLESGELAYILNDSKTEEDSAWGQVLSGEDKQAYPVPGGRLVYKTAPCESYTNNSEEIVKKHHATAWTIVEEANHGGICTVCGEELVEEHVDVNGDMLCDVCNAIVLPRVTYSHTLTLQSDITLNYYVSTAGLEGFENVTLHVEKDVYNKAGEYTVEKSTLIGELVTSTYGQEYKFRYAGIAVYEAGNEIRAYLSAEKDGVVYEFNVDTYSVKAYCYNQLAKSSATDKLKMLMVDFLNYAAEAQKYFEIRTNELVNADLTDAQLELGGQNENALNNMSTEEVLEGATAEISGKTLVLSNTVELKVYMKLPQAMDKSGVTVKLQYVKLNGKKVTKEIPFSEFAYTSSSKEYSIRYDGFLAPEFRSVVSIAIYNNGKRISNLQKYSIETYAYNRIKADSSTEQMKSLVKSMMMYSDSAAEYLKK